MDIKISFSQIVPSFLRFVSRYHVLLFVLFAFGGLSVSTFILYQTVASSQQAAPTSSAATFDKKTIEEIRNLRSSKEASSDLTLPAGRNNPFSE